MIDESLASLRAQTAGRYAIDRELGRGGMATVYLARDIRHDRLVALKTLHPEFAVSVGAERFLREIRVAARLQHQNIVAVFDSGGEGAQLWYTMPYIAGESLRDRLAREGRLPVASAIRITRQVTAALAAAHAGGIVHRDIKPENILLQGDHALVADFGIARAAAAPEPLTGTGMSLGTPAYMSPEQVSGDQVDGRSDIFSLGCVWYEMLAGQPPYPGATQQAALMRRLLEPAAPIRNLRPEVAPSLEGILARALARAPDDRFPTAEAFASALDDAVMYARAQTSAGRVSRSRWRNATLAGGALVIVVFALLTARTPSRPAGDESGADRSLAVLEFRNNSPDSADAFLASGLTDEVTSRLGDLPRLRVKGRRAVAALPSTPADDYRSIGRTLGVRYLVEGSVRRAARRVKITVQLVTTADGFRVWGQDYDGASADLMALQEDIARNVARQIAGELLPREQATLSARGTAVPAAYEHFLRGNFLLGQRNAEATARAIAQYDSALAGDPAYTQARARSAYAYAQFLDWGWEFPGVPANTVLARGLAASAGALAHDSTAAEAWLARGYLITFADPLHFAGAEQAFARAIALDSGNAEAHHQFGWVLHQLGRDSLALAEYHRALVLEPDRPSTLRLIALVDLFAGRYRVAERWLDSSLRIDPGFYSAYGLRGLARLRLGNLTGARADGEQSLRVRASDPLRGEFVLVLADAAGGAPDAARARAIRLITQSGTGPLEVWDAWYLAIALLGVGDQEGAAALVDRVPERGVAFRFAFGAADLESLRPAVRRRMGLQD
jgi:serine/threonine-protein kinase